MARQSQRIGPTKSDPDVLGRVSTRMDSMAAVAFHNANEFDLLGRFGPAVLEPAASEVIAGVLTDLPQLRIGDGDGVTNNTGGNAALAGLFAVVAGILRGTGKTDEGGKALASMEVVLRVLEKVILGFIKNTKLDATAEAVKNLEAKDGPIEQMNKTFADFVLAVRDLEKKTEELMANPAAKVGAWLAAWQKVDGGRFDLQKKIKLILETAGRGKKK